MPAVCAFFFFNSVNGEREFLASLFVCLLLGLEVVKKKVQRQRSKLTL